MLERSHASSRTISPVIDSDAYYLSMARCISFPTWRLIDARALQGNSSNFNKTISAASSSLTRGRCWQQLDSTDGNIGTEVTVATIRTSPCHAQKILTAAAAAGAEHGDHFLLLSTFSDRTNSAAWCRCCSVSMLLKTTRYGGL